MWPDQKSLLCCPFLPWLPWRGASAVTAGGGPETQPGLLTVSEMASLPMWAEFLPLFILFLVLVPCRALLEDQVWGNAQSTPGTALAHCWAKPEAAQPSWFIYSQPKQSSLESFLGQFISVPSVSRVLCVISTVSPPGFDACLLSPCLWYSGADSGVVTTDVTSWFSSRVRFVLLKYNTSNPAQLFPLVFLIFQLKGP